MTSTAIDVGDAVRAAEVTKSYGRNQALRECTLSVPSGRVAALVGPNGAGKTTLMHAIVGLAAPDTGTLTVLGEVASRQPRHLAKLAFMPQDNPLYNGFTVAEMLRFGRTLNPGWDQDLATDRLARLGIPTDCRIGRLSGGQHAQVALTLALAKRPQLLVLDEPLASLDPIARDEVMRDLMTAVAEQALTVLMSSHVVSDIENTCDWLIVLNQGQVKLEGDLEELTAAHKVLTGPVELAQEVTATLPVITDSRTARQATLLVHGDTDNVNPQWRVRAVDLEELVLAYLRRPSSVTEWE